MTTDTASLYKNNLLAEMKQIERRHMLLEKQRLMRQKGTDQHRRIIKQIRNFQKQQREEGYTNRRYYRNVLQMSEWMHERPDDLENWYMVACPKGIRCLIVAEDGRTEAIGKYGNLILAFPSRLPGGSRSKGANTESTILDGFLDKEGGRFYAIDVLAYGNQNLMECDCEFRFYWLQSKIQENSLHKEKLNKIPICQVPYVSFQNPLAIDEFLGTFPQFHNNVPKLDGLLFYHKESQYVSGKTPLVLWLFPFMVPEVLNIHSLHHHYTQQKPIIYHGYKKYIEEFDAKFVQKEKAYQQKREQRKSKNKMEVQEVETPKDESDTQKMDDSTDENIKDKIEQQMYLLETGAEDTN